MKQKRNAAAIGRYFAGLLAIVLCAVLPLQYIAKTEAESVASNAQAALDRMVSDVCKQRMITEADYIKLMEVLGASGAVYNVEIMVGQKLHGIDDSDDTRIDVPIMTYTNEILSAIETTGSFPLSKGDSVTVKITERSKSSASKIANAFLSTHIEPNEYISGWIVN
jgi:hypothetical protein